MKPANNNPWTVRNKFRGQLTSKSTAVVMDNSRDRDNPNKVVVNYFITENTSLLAGQNTVAVFSLKRHHEWTDETALIDELKTGDSFRTNPFGLILIKKSNTEAINPFGQTIAINEDHAVYVVKRKEESLNSTSLFTNYFDKKKSAVAINNDTQ